MLTRAKRAVNALEQGSLRRSRPAEPGRIEPEALVGVQAQPLARDAKAIAQQLRILPLSFHAAAELRIVLAAAAHVADARHHAFGLERGVLLEPILEQPLQ